MLAVFWSDNCRHDCSKSAQSQIWKSSSFQDTRPSFHVTGFVRVDEADALTDLGSWGWGPFWHPSVTHRNSIVIQECIISPLEEKSWGGEGMA